MNRKIMKCCIGLTVICCTLVTNVKTPYAMSTDFDNHWAHVQINKWLDNGMIKGYPNNMFKPDAAISRAEFIAIVNRIFDYNSKGLVKFTDLSSSDWYYDDIAKAIKAGYINGSPEGTVKPNSPITRQEAAIVLSTAFGFDNQPSDSYLKFQDASSISSWAADYVRKMVDLGVIKGYDNGMFRPLNHVTRAEAVSMLDRISGEIYSKQNTTLEGKRIEGNLVINKPNINLKDVVIEGNLYISGGIDPNVLEFHNVTVKGNIFIKGCLLNNVTISKSTIDDIIIDSPDSHVQVFVNNDSEVKRIIVYSSSNLSVLSGSSVDAINLMAPSTINISEQSSLNVINASSSAEKSVIYSKAGITINTKASAISVNGKAIGNGTIVTQPYNFELIDVY